MQTTCKDLKLITKQLKVRVIMERAMTTLIEKLCECQAMCKYCFNACLEEDNVQMMTRCIKLDVECAEICGLAISSVSYEGGFTPGILKICAEACRKCAEECRKHQYIHCLECAKACEECAKACETYN